MHDSGDLLLAIADGAIPGPGVATELGNVIAGTAPGRAGPDEVTLYNSVGIAMQDIAIGSLLIEKARAAGIGREIDLSA
jgi:ornithine cyclodeaminase/alanine dehydrogenase